MSINANVVVQQQFSANSSGTLSRMTRSLILTLKLRMCRPDHTIKALFLVLGVLMCLPICPLLECLVLMLVLHILLRIIAAYHLSAILILQTLMPCLITMVICLLVLLAHQVQVLL
ncbi:hypothetical protein Goshw_015095, partial [Gossypium schwendimanii]|nr:hypothetical protein [Gossypium schwendimanii]